METTLQTRPSIAVVDDDAAVLRSVTRLLKVHGFDSNAYTSPKLLLENIEVSRPDCIIADLSMPEFDGFDLQRSLGGLEHDFPIVFITGYGDIRSSVKAMRNGAVDFLAKPVEQEELLEAVNRALSRAKASREEERRLGKFRRRLASLTQREREVFERVVAGELNKQIAASLGIAEKTVKVHRARVMRKMAVRSLASLARVAEQIGVESPLR